MGVGLRKGSLRPGAFGGKRFLRSVHERPRVHRAPRSQMEYGFRHRRKGGATRARSIEVGKRDPKVTTVTNAKHKGETFGGTCVTKYYGGYKTKTE